MDFQNALKKMPNCAMGNFDPLAHKTVNDLRYCVRHELDLFQEGEDSDIKSMKQAEQCIRFLDQVKL